MIIGAIDKDSILEERLRKQNVELIEISELKPHEEFCAFRLGQVKESIISEGLKHPIVVDRATKIILDGHHRYNTLKALKIKKVPVFYVDYFDEKIIIDSWNGKKLTKKDVVDKVNSGGIFPKKTTKHMIRSDSGLVHISLIMPAINLDIFKINGNGRK